MNDRSTRSWVWASLVLQFFGYVFDAVWHGLLRPGLEPKTVGEMVQHLGTVHLPLYIGAASVLVSVARAALRERRESVAGGFLSVALAGAAVSFGAEVWHALSHLRLDTHSAPVAGVLSVVGFIVVVIAVARAGRPPRRRAAKTSNRHAA